MKVCFLTASGMYYEKNRAVEHCVLNKDLFLQKPISNEDLVSEINKEDKRKLTESISCLENHRCSSKREEP